MPQQKNVSAPFFPPSFRLAGEKKSLKLRLVSPPQRNAEDFDFLAEAAAAHRAQRHYAACGR